MVQINYFNILLYKNEYKNLMYYKTVELSLEKIQFVKNVKL